MNKHMFLEVFVTLDKQMKNRRANFNVARAQSSSMSYF